MNEKMISLLRGTRTLLHVVAEPLDLAVRSLNNKRGYPPLRLRQQVGNLNDFEGSSGEYVSYLKLLCGLKLGDRLLDIGCGCGLILLDTTGAGSLLNYVGSYKGLDCNKEVIGWCRRNIKEGNASFDLVEGDGYLYHRGSSFDVILAKSLFTHLLKGETENYLGGIKRLLKPGGRCLATFFLFDDEEPRGKYTFKYPEWPVCYERITKPRLAVAYDEDWLSRLLEKLGLTYEVYYGTWSGRQDGLSFQDLIVMRREQ